MKMIEDFYQIDNYPFSESKAIGCFEKLSHNEDLGRFWLIHDERNKTVGYLIVCFGFSFEYGGRDAFIDEFYIIPEERGKGIGTEILKKLKDVAKQLDIKAIHLEVEKTNEIGNELYHKAGFRGNSRSLLTQIID